MEWQERRWGKKGDGARDEEKYGRQGIQQNTRKAVDEKEGGGGGESLSILIIIIFQQDLQYEVRNCC